MKGPKHTETKSIIFSKAYIEIEQALETFIEKASTKNKLETSTLTIWRETVLIMLKEKIKNLKQKI